MSNNGMTRLRCGSVLTMTDDEPDGPQIVEIDDGLVSRIYPASQAGHDAAVAEDLSGYTLLPGLIDAHSHLEMINILQGDEPGQLSAPDHVLALRCAANAQANLRHGITAMRLPGTKGFIDVELRRLVRREELEGPDLFIAGMGLMSSLSPNINSITADGVEGVTRAVRLNLSHDVDFIKIFATGPTGPKSHGRGLPYYSPEEIRAAVETARAFGKPVAAHAYGGEAIEYCVDAGVDHIEHGSLMTPEQYDRLASSGTWLVGTLSVFLEEPGLAELSSMSQQQRDRMLWAREEQRKGVQEVARSGVKFALGTDGIHGHGLAREAELAASAGLGNRKAIAAITRDAARLCALEPVGGIIQPGARADLIAVEGDPLTDIKALRNVRFVMRRGRKIL